MAHRPTLYRVRPIDEAYSAESIDQATQLFSNNYMSVVDEIASFQTDPDLRRAETRRHEMASFGGFLADALRAFGAMMQGGLEELAVQPGGQLEALPLQEVATSSQVMW